jgi:hypothetical protein
VTPKLSVIPAPVLSYKERVRSLRDIGEGMFPANTRPAIVVFWIKYWAWFFLLLPWMLFRQIFISLHQALGALWTWNRRVDLFDGALSLVFMTSLPSIAVTLIFGERNRPVTATGMPRSMTPSAAFSSPAIRFCTPSSRRRTRTSRARTGSRRWNATVAGTSRR